MGGEALWELVKVFLAALFASTLTHLLTHRRFIQGRWWDRKDKAYGDIISSLVGLIRSLEWQKRAEERWGTEPEYEPPEEVRKAVLGEYKEARDRIERAVVEGDYVVTRKAANALAELVEALEVGLPKPIFDTPQQVGASEREFHNLLGTFNGDRVFQNV
jgi:hypothetical protein